MELQQRAAQPPSPPPMVLEQTFNMDSHRPTISQGPQHFYLGTGTQTDHTLLQAALLSDAMKQHLGSIGWGRISQPPPPPSFQQTPIIQQPTTQQLPLAPSLPPQPVTQQQPSTQQLPLSQSSPQRHVILPGGVIPLDSGYLAATGRGMPSVISAG